MVNWTQTGRNPDLDGGWAGKGSKTNFKSRFEIISPNGIRIPFSSKEDGIPTWDRIPPNSKIEWAINTDGKADRAELKLTYFDMERYLAAYNQVLDNLSEEEIKMLESGDTKLIERVNTDSMNRAGGIESLFIVYWSDVLTTDGSGNASGTIDITEAFPLNTSYIFTAHYGYDANQERGDTSKTIEFVWDIASIPLMFVPGLNVVIGVAFVAEMAYIGAKLAASGFGKAGENKYGEFFPVGGFNHVYSFFLENPEQPPEDYVATILSDENLDIVQKMNLLAQFYGTMKIGAGLAGALILISLLKGRRS